MSKSDTRSVAEKDLRGSIALLAFILLLSVVTLGFQGNWPKVLRVSSAFAVYATILLVLARRASRHGVVSPRPLPVLWFTAAGTVAGVVSGLVRPVFDASTLIIGTAGGALLIGTVHRAALVFGRRAFDDLHARAPEMAGPSA